VFVCALDYGRQEALVGPRYIAVNTTTRISVTKKNETSRHIRLSSEISVNALFSIALGLLLCLFEDKFCNMTVEFLVRNCARHRCAHRSPDEVGDHRGE
jgi:hypothetical protein